MTEVLNPLFMTGYTHWQKPGPQVDLQLTVAAMTETGWTAFPNTAFTIGEPLTSYQIETDIRTWENLMPHPRFHLTPDLSTDEITIRPQIEPSVYTPQGTYVIRKDFIEEFSFLKSARIAHRFVKGALNQSHPELLEQLSSMQDQPLSVYLEQLSDLLFTGPYSSILDLLFTHLDEIDFPKRPLSPGGQELVTTPLGSFVDRHSFTRILSQVFTSTNKLHNFLSSHLYKNYPDLIGKLRSMKELSLWDYCGELADAIFTDAPHQTGAIDDILDAAITNLKGSQRTAMIALQYSGFNPQAHSSPSLTKDHEAQILKSLIPSGHLPYWSDSDAPGKTAAILHQNNFDTFSDFDKVLLLEFLRHQVRIQAHPKKRQRLLSAIHVIQTDLKSRSWEYKELAKTYRLNQRRPIDIETQRFWERSIGLILGLGPRHAGLSMDTETFITSESFTKDELFMFACEIRSRYLAGYHGGLSVSEINERLSLLNPDIQV